MSITRETRFKIKKAFEDSLARVDFDLIHSFMKINKWKYSDKSPAYIPTVEDLRRTCWELFNEITYPIEEYYSISGGGFTLSIHERSLEIYFSINYASTSII